MSNIKDFVEMKKEISYSDANGNIQGVAPIRDKSKLNGTMRVRLHFVGHINPTVKDEMIEELEAFVKKFYL